APVRPKKEPAPEVKAEPTAAKADITEEKRPLQKMPVKPGPDDLERLIREKEILREQQEFKELERVRAMQIANANQALVDDYKSRIRAKIRRNVVMPPGMEGNPQAEYSVTLLPSGEVLDVELLRGSGSESYDSAVERAIYKSQPLPLPPQSSLFVRFRELKLIFRPQDTH
ncbi:MAG: energy transducer TonB, partial [Burkholderiales bacterium]